MKRIVTVSATAESCEICKSKLAEPVLKISRKSDDDRGDVFEFVAHGSCAIADLDGQYDRLRDDILSLKSKLQTLTVSSSLYDSFLKEMTAKGCITITKDMVMYSQGSQLFLKLTDYQKGYWAQVPLTLSETLLFIKFLENVSKNV